MSVLDEARGLCMDARELERRAATLLVGRRVRIARPWHDQPWGASKPDLKGQAFAVSGAHFDHGRLYLWLEGLQCAIPSGYVDVIEPFNWAKSVGLAPMEVV